jgi:hypothetical protein
MVSTMGEWLKAPEPMREPSNARNSSHEMWYSFWMNTVTEFTSKDLTNPSDRLPAVAGLAAPMSVILLDDEYLAGAWSGALTRTLAWFSKARLGAEKPPEAVSGAPSWSWASVNAPISWLDSREDDQHLAWYLGHESVRATKSPFGSLTSSRLKVKGKTLWGKRGDRVGMSGFSRDLGETYGETYDDFGQLYEVYVHCYYISKTESIFASAGTVYFDTG